MSHRHPSGRLSVLVTVMNWCRRVCRMAAEDDGGPQKSVTGDRCSGVTPCCMSLRPIKGRVQRAGIAGAGIFCPEPEEEPEPLLWIFCLEPEPVQSRDATRIP